MRTGPKSGRKRLIFIHPLRRKIRKWTRKEFFLRYEDVLTSFYVEFCFEIAQNMTKIDMEKFSIPLDHIISRMPITNAHYVSSNQVASTRSNKIFFCYSKFLLILVHSFQIFESWSVIKGFHQVIRVFFMNVWTILGILDNLYKTNTIPGG